MTWPPQTSPFRGGESRAGAARLANDLCAARAERRLGHQDRRCSRRVLRRLWSFYLGTASKDGQPYVQYRGGSPGFLRVIDDRTLAFADFAGNRQYITIGNLSENPKAFIFLMDYVNSSRVKVCWGRPRVVENDPELLERLRDPDYPGKGRAGHRVHRRGMGHQLPAAHPANGVCRGCRSGHRCARRAHRRARG